MTVLHTEIFFLFLSLRDLLVGAQIIVYTQTEGAALTVQCSVSFVEGRKFFCKEPCEQDRILIGPSVSKAPTGTFSFGFTGSQTGRAVSVTFRQLTKADSGLYRCGWYGGGRDSYQHIEVIVVDAMLDGIPSKEKTLHVRSGGNIVVECSFAGGSGQKYFCQENCRTDNILVTTTGAKVTKGRYSIEYLQAAPEGGVLIVSIAGLTPSDSGSYRCGVGQTRRRKHRKFRVSVTDDPTMAKPNLPDLTSEPSAATPTTTQREATTTDYVCLYVGLTLAILAVLLALAVLLYCRKKSSGAKEPPADTEYASVSQANRVYENIGRDGQSRSPPADVSSTYTSVRRPNGTTAGDDSTKLTYSELIFPDRRNDGVVHRDANHVIYSVPRTAVTSAYLSAM